MKKLRYIKWWFQRANRKLPPCDCWDYKYTLVDNLEQGLSFLLHEGMTDWEQHSKERKDLEYILDWAREFPYYDTALFAADENEKAELQQKFDGNYIVCTKKDFEEWQKRTEKAFQLLAKYIHGLWD